jgi:hypothetical protein
MVAISVVSMQNFLRLISLLIWALWFGGVMGLFLSVQILFHQTDRAVFLIAAPHLFIAFEQYQLILATIAVVLTFARRVISPAPWLTTLLVLFVLATAGAVVERTLITPRIEAMRILGQTHTPEFMKIHGLSMCVYMTVAIILLVAGLVQSLRPKQADIIPA